MEREKEKGNNIKSKSCRVGIDSRYGSSFSPLQESVTPIDGVKTEAYQFRF